MRLGNSSGVKVGETDLGQAESTGEVVTVDRRDGVDGKSHQFRHELEIVILQHDCELNSSANDAKLTLKNPGHSATSSSCNPLEKNLFLLRSPVKTSDASPFPCASAVWYSSSMWSSAGSSASLIKSGVRRLSGRLCIESRKTLGVGFVTVANAFSAPRGKVIEAMFAFSECGGGEQQISKLARQLRGRISLRRSRSRPRR